MHAQWLERESTEKLQWERLVDIIRYAYEYSDYYRDLFDGHGINVEQFDKKEFSKIPVLTKDLIRESTEQILNKEFSTEQLVVAKTGGSTGKALTIYFDKRWQEIRTADMLRGNSWANWNMGDKCAAIWGNPPVPHTFKEHAWHKLIDRMIYLDTMNMNVKSMGDFVRLWDKENPSVIFGHSHSIYIFAKYLHDNQVKHLRPKGIISTSMMLIKQERELIEKVFSCKVTDRYGCEEVGLIASECKQHDGMHLNIEHLYIEFLDDQNNPVKLGEPGKIVVTDLFNHAMPLIRYRVEDVGVLTERQCICGRKTPMMEKLTGRVADFIKHINGSLVAGVSLVERTLTAYEGIEQMQIVQDKLEQIVLNVVKAPTYNEETEKKVLDEFRAVFGDRVDININYIDRIPQESSGKYRFSICNV